MRTPRRRSPLHFVLLLAAAVTLLPPGAWSLCLGDGGHVALEPSATACHDEGGGEGTDACRAEAHDDCVDTLLLSGQVAPGSPELLLAPSDVPGPVYFDTFARARWAPHSRVRPYALSGTATTLLRC